ncbi:MAG TPA: M1 family aminopeptidase, partial [Gemmataceae bacterium]|nr:M1 family aminopeptidase [Gemmataceae bacterium]
RPASELVFNAHSHFQMPDGEIGFYAKMMEILRMQAGEALYAGEPPLEIAKVRLLSHSSLDIGHLQAAAIRDSRTSDLPFHYHDENLTALVVPLPKAVGKDESVSIEIAYTLKLPPYQGRWGQWQGVTFLTNWLPVLAVYDDSGWQPTPFVPWHQPFFNEAGIFSVRVTLPADQKLASTASVFAERNLGNGWRQVDLTPVPARDFAILCSDRYQEYTGQAGPVRVRVLAFPEHEHYAKEMVRIACEAIPTYCKWFGPYPYDQFTIAESYFGWNGNECSGLVMIDERVFGMPHLAGAFVDYLVSHETCHQWWYNVVGTNGYCETWMDEGLATYFSHRLQTQKCGRHNSLIQWPHGLEWMPNIDRENYRHYGLYGTIGRGEACACVQEIPKFGHIVNLFSMCYDKGSKIVGMIEDRLGEAAFYDFMRRVYSRYYFRILRVADFQRELEEYTGQSWEEFFKHWLHEAGMTDWAVESVKMDPPQSVVRRAWSAAFGRGPMTDDRRPAVKVTVILQQKAEYSEETILGFAFDNSEHYQIRIPIVPEADHLEFDNPPARIDTISENRVRVEVTLPCAPTQIAVDPDQVLVDKNPANNYWKPRVRWRFTPLFTFLEETDLTTDYDKWNVTAGPWMYSPLYDDPWFTRSTMFGVRAAAYRMQHFTGGVYAAYRTDFRDVVAGVDALWDHFPWTHTQVGFIAERRLATAFEGEQDANRGTVFGRYIIDYGDSLYLPPMQYVEAFTTVQQNFLPLPRESVPGAERYDRLTKAGLHYHINYLTPYWDPEGGYQFDATYNTGVEIPGERKAHHDLNELSAQLSFVKCLPNGLGWLSDTKLAGRIYGAAGLPNRVEYFSLGGETLFRGYDMAQRQGSLAWVASAEWRIPIATGITWDVLDHTAGLRNIYLAAFYDVGDAYLRNRQIGPIAHAFGAGIRLDIAWFSFIERSLFRVDVAKTINDNTPVQVWFGVQHPF